MFIILVIYGNSCHICIISNHVCFWTSGKFIINFKFIIFQFCNIINLLKILIAFAKRLNISYTVNHKEKKHQGNLITGTGEFFSYIKR